MAEPEILTIEEVAQILRVSERTVYEWAQKGIIPGGKLGTSWRFKRSDIQRWVDERLNSRKKRMSSHPVALRDLLTPERVVFLNSTHKNEALRELIKVLATAPEVRNRDELEKEIFHREELMSTGIGFGVAVPHVRLASVTNITMAMAVCRSDITDYPSLDGKPVRIICMIAAGRDQHAKYIKALAEISSILKEKAVRESLITAPDPQSAYSIMIREGV